MKLEDLRLKGRVAVVTGGSRGIGRAVVELLAELGADIVVNYRKDAAAAEESVNAAREKGAVALSFGGDIADVATSQRLVDFAVKRFKRLDLLICSAGIWEGSPVNEMNEEMWDRTMDVNLKGTWAVCRAATRVMKEQKFGKIVIVSSTAGQRGEANYSNYAASKGGQIAFTKSLAEELGKWGINVNAVAPGWVDTEMTTEALGDSARRAEAAGGIPLGRIATPEEIAAPIAFLCSDWARHITGEILNVNGGAVLCG